MNKIFLSVIIPCYNESGNLKKEVLADVYNYLKNMKFSWEVIISDDGSSDDSVSLIKKEIINYKNFRLLENPHGGKPSALKYGIDASKGDYVLFTDKDQSTPIDQIAKLTPFVKEKYKVIIGSRGFSRKNFPIYRRLGSIVFTRFRKLLILHEINDTQCGFKMFEKDLVASAFPKLAFFKTIKQVKGWKVTSWDVELLHIFKRMGIEIAEVEVEWRSEDESVNKGGGLSRYFKESWEMLFQIIRVKINDIRGLYNS